MTTRRSFLITTSTLLVARRWPMAAITRRAAPLVTLSATTSKSTYRVGEQVVIAPVLTNAGTDVVRLTDQIDGTLRIHSLTVDGVPVPTRETVTDFYTELGYSLKRSLVSVAPGESRPMALWRGDASGGVGASGQGLRTVRYVPGGTNPTTYHVIATPGQYLLNAYYQFPPALAYGATPPIFVDSSARVTLAFTVVP